MKLSLLLPNVEEEGEAGEIEAARVGLGKGRDEVEEEAEKEADRGEGGGRAVSRIGRSE